MKLKFFSLLAVGAPIFAVALAGCGGGSSSPSNPTPTQIPTTNVAVTVQLRDSTGAPVDGLVTLGSQRRATTNGNASFANVVAGALTASAEVNGATYSQNFVATPGANTVQIAVNPNVGSTTGGTTGGEPPAPPTF